MGDVVSKLSLSIDNCSKYVLNDCESDCSCSKCLACHVKTNEVDLEHVEGDG